MPSYFENFHLSVKLDGVYLVVGLHDILSPIARTLKVLSLSGRLRLAGLCEELEAMVGHYVLEALSIRFFVEDNDTEDSIGSTIRKVETGQTWVVCVKTYFLYSLMLEDH